MSIEQSPAFPSWRPEMGTRWLHLWVEAAPLSHRVLVWFQFEVGGLHTGIPQCVEMAPTAARKLFDTLCLCRPVKHDDTHLSISLD